METEKQEVRQRVQALRQQLETLVKELGVHFARTEARDAVGRYLQGLLNSVERKNTWQLAEQTGQATPYAFQHLLGRARWQEDAVRDAHLQGVGRGLGTQGILAVDETGFLKKGTKSAGVARQYCGTAGKIENCQIGVFLAWQTPKGCTFLDRQL